MALRKCLPIHPANKGIKVAYRVGRQLTRDSVPPPMRFRSPDRQAFGLKEFFRPSYRSPGRMTSLSDLQSPAHALWTCIPI
jgi:hypothetical protein